MTFTEIFQIIYKTILCYFFILFCLKIMGKREIGEISAFDIVVFFIISELFSLSLNEPEHSILRSIIPVSIIVLLQLVTALISLYVPKFRSLMEGKKSYLIYKGVIQQNEMKRQRYTIEDLMAQLRMKEIQTPQDVEYAILENNGELTIIKKDNCIMLSTIILLDVFNASIFSLILFICIVSCFMFSSITIKPSDASSISPVWLSVASKDFRIASEASLENSFNSSTIAVIFSVASFV